MVTQSGESVSQNMIIKNSYKELPSERFYDWLDRDLTSTTQYYSDCNKLSHPYKNNQEIRSLCAKVVKYIKTKPSILNGNHLKDHQCNLFNYWLYEKLIRYYGDSSSVPFHVFGDFLRVLSGFTYYPKDVTCKLDNSIPMIPDRQDRKKLYDYCVDYKTILDNYKHSKEKCQKYYTYVKKKIELYKKFHKLCSPDYESKCPDLYKICEDKEPKHLLSQLKCDGIGVEKKTQLKGTPDSDLSGTTSNSFHGIQSVSDMGNVFLGVVVTSMTSAFLYKFTPLGTRIRNGLLWNNNNMSNLNTNVDELLGQESYSPYLGEEQHYIGYHAS
ncbi:VIR protein [Plasmodium vivax]|uniref:VIR protein n=1 Tax=Plasmodium vivax TaxID=5855 RepID=A0A1G4EDU3_PLAVI|nr:VIR protein [Plasmodium vivax]